MFCHFADLCCAQTARLYTKKFISITGAPYISAVFCPGLMFFLLEQEDGANLRACLF